MTEKGFVGFVARLLAQSSEEGLGVDLVGRGELFIGYDGDGFDFAGEMSHGRSAKILGDCLD